MNFAVAYYNCFDSELVLEIIQADSWRDALSQHSAFDGQEMQDFAKDIPNDLEEAKEFFFNNDSSIDVVEIPCLMG